MSNELKEITNFNPPIVSNASPLSEDDFGNTEAKVTL